jgi:hypothetical protein
MFKISLNRIHDTIRIREGNDALNLSVDADAMRMVAGLNKARNLLQSITEETTEEQRNEAARYFAAVIFGDEQAGKLMDFYRGDAGCVINVCGQYFAKRLSAMIAKAQKKLK